MRNTDAKKTHRNTGKKKHLTNTNLTNTKRSAVKKVTINNAANLLKTAETKLARELAALDKATTRVAITDEKAKAAAEKARKTGRAASVNVAKRAKDIVVQARLQRQIAAAAVKTARESLRDAKQRVKVEQQEQRLKERKETAKQKAVAAFIKNWEREWDKKIKKAA